MHTHTGPFYNWSRPFTRRGVIYVIFEASQQKMEFLAEEIVYCPYCGEALDVLIDHQEAGQQYIEDCQVCCKPIVFKLALNEMGDVSVSVHDEDDAY
ncbi:MAG: CPXCG motif-containing cysteine-rich protein [Pseudomonadales bacterium]